MSGSSDRTLIIEVSVGDDSYSYQLGSERVWQQDRDGVMQELVQPAASLLLCLRMEALRRYLDLPVAEDLLAFQARDLWQRHFPDQQVTAWSLTRIAPEPPLPEAPFAQAAELVATLPNHPAVASLVDPTLSPDPDIVPAQPANAETDQISPEPVRWCDVDTIPPRTLAVDRLPDIHPYVHHDDEGDALIEIVVAAFGPAGRVPAVTKLMATVWDTGTDEVLANVVLSYDRQFHSFRGCGPRMPGDYRIDGLGVDAAIGLDISAIEQLHPLPRDAEHDNAWRRWWDFNRQRRELVNRFRADGSAAGYLTLAEQMWALTQPPIAARIVSEDDWLLGVVELDIPGVGTAYFSPCLPALDSGVWAMDTQALRRLAVVEYFAAWRNPPIGVAGNAWAIDRGLAHAGVGDLATARRYLQEQGEWLNWFGQQTADRAPSSYVLDVLAECCQLTACYVADPLARDLRETANTLTAGIAVDRDLVDSGVLIHDRQPGTYDLPALRLLARQVWLARRAASAEKLALGQNKAATPRAASALSGRLRRKTAEHGDWQVEMEALDAYPFGGTGADRPLLAELVASLEH